MQKIRKRKVTTLVELLGRPPKPGDLVQTSDADVSSALAALGLPEDAPLIPAAIRMLPQSVHLALVLWLAGRWRSGDHRPIRVRTAARALMPEEVPHDPAS